MSNLKGSNPLVDSGSGDASHKTNKHVVIRTDHFKTSPRASIGEMPARPTSLYVSKESRRESRTRSKSIDATPKKSETKTSSLDKLHRLKERLLLHSSPQLHDETTESTPLVSGAATIFSPNSNGKRIAVMQTSDCNLEVFELSPSKSLNEECSNDFSPVEESNCDSWGYLPRDRCRTISEREGSTEMCSISPNSPLGNASIGSLGSRSSHGSGHFYRQDALDSQESLLDIIYDS